MLANGGTRNFEEIASFASVSEWITAKNLLAPKVFCQGSNLLHTAFFTETGEKSHFGMTKWLYFQNLLRFTE